MRTNRIEIFKSQEDYKWYFHLVAKNNKIQLQTLGRPTLRITKEASVRLKFSEFTVLMKKSENDQFYFKVFVDGKLIAWSETYVSEMGAKKGLEAVERNLKDAVIVEI